MNTIKILIITIISFISLKAATPIELVNSIASLDINMQYYFFVENKKAFLVKEKKDKSLALWYYTNDRKWQPIHNAGAFDGYPKVEETLDNVSFSTSSNTLSTGSAIGKNGVKVPPTPPGMPVIY